jgi:hypothetical protein
MDVRFREIMGECGIQAVILFVEQKFFSETTSGGDDWREVF